MHLKKVEVEEGEHEKSEEIQDKIVELEKEMSSLGITRFRASELKRQIALFRSQKF